METHRRHMAAIRTFCNGNYCKTCPLDSGNGCEAIDILTKDRYATQAVIEKLREKGVDIYA